MLEYIETIPAIEWDRGKDIAAFFGALLAFAGLLLQLSHSAREARKQRAMELKAQVYFEASNSLAHMATILAALAESNITPKSVSDATSGLYKLHLVAGNQLIEKLVLCGQYFGNAVFDIICDRLVIQSLTAQSEHALNMHKMHLEQASYLTKTYTNASADLAKTIKAEQDSLQLKMGVCLEHHESAYTTKAQKQLELAEKTIGHVGSFNTLMAECVPDIRQDLENKFSAKDAADYKVIISRSIEATQRTSEEFIAKVRAKIPEFELPDL